MEEFEFWFLPFFGNFEISIIPQILTPFLSVYGAYMVAKLQLETESKREMVHREISLQQQDLLMIDNLIERGIIDKLFMYIFNKNQLTYYFKNTFLQYEQIADFEIKIEGNKLKVGGGLLRNERNPYFQKIYDLFLQIEFIKPRMQSVKYQRIFGDLEKMNIKYKTAYTIWNDIGPGINDGLVEKVLTDEQRCQIEKYLKETNYAKDFIGKFKRAYKN